MSDSKKFENRNPIPPWLGGIVLYRPTLGSADKLIRPAMIVHVHPNSDADNLMDYVDIVVFSPSGQNTIARVPFVQVDSSDGVTMKDEGRGQWQWPVKPAPRGAGEVTEQPKGADEGKKPADPTYVANPDTKKPQEDDK